MDRKYYTFLIFPGAHGKLRKIQLPPYIVQLILGCSVAGLMTLGALANSYAHMLMKVSDYNTMRIEREVLKTQYHSLEGVVSRTNVELGSLQSLAAEVALAYSFTEGGRPGLPGGVLLMANRGHVALGGDYDASLHVFKLMKATPLLASSAVAAASPFVPPAFESTSIPSIWPVHGMISAGFGQRMDPFTGEGAFHTGVDIAAPAGTAIIAAADGIVFHAGPDSGYGNEILIDHGYGLTTKYGHLSKISVVVGQEVSQGEIVGAVGMTGWATGPHLHYEVLVGGTPVNPAPYLRD